MWLKRALFIVLAIALLFSAISPMVVNAEEPGGFTIGIEVNADGSWKVVELLGRKMDLTPQAFNSFAGLLGMRMNLPDQILPQRTVAVLTRAGVSQMTLAMEGQTTKVWVNDRFLPEIELNPSVVTSLVGDKAGLFTNALALVQGAAYVRFPRGEAARPDLSRTVKPAARESEISNSVQVAATLNSEGKWLSAGGFTRRDAAAAGIQLPLNVDPTLSAFLANYERIEVEVTPSEFVLRADDEPAVRLLWDGETRLAFVETAQDLLGAGLDPRLGAGLDPQIFEMAESWLQTSNVNLVLHIADEARDGTPIVEIGRPILIVLNGADAPTVAGVPIYGLDPRVEGTVMQIAQFTGIHQVQACWTQGQLGLRISGMSMPYITVSEGWLTKAIELTGLRPLSTAGKLEQALANVTVPVVLSVGEGPATPATDCGAYEVAAAEAPLAVNLEATWSRQSNELTLGKLDLPILMPLDIAAQIHVPGASAFIPASLSSITASVGPSGFSADVDGVNVAIHWDSTLLSNLAQVVDELGYGDYVRQAAQVVKTTEINVSIESAEEIATSPEARLEETAQTVASLAPVAAEADEPATVAGVQEIVEQSVTQGKAPVEVEEPAVESPVEEAMVETASHEPEVCVVPDGGTLWDCWLQFGGSEGTGLSWADWSEAVVETYGLELSSAGEPILQPGDTIAMLPTQ